MREFILYLKENKRTRNIIILLAVGALLILLSAAFAGSGDGAADKSETLDEYRERLEAEISAVCSDVEGVGRCRVYITLERGEQSIYKGSSLIETKPPKVLGVTVICRGADSQAVRCELTDMLCALFDIGANRVAILKLN